MGFNSGFKGLNGPEMHVVER